MEEGEKVCSKTTKTRKAKMTLDKSLKTKIDTGTGDTEQKGSSGKANLKIPVEVAGAKTFQEVLETLASGTLGQKGPALKTIETDKSPTHSITTATLIQQDKLQCRSIEEGQDEGPPETEGPPVADPVVKVMEHFLMWIDEVETEQILTKDILAIQSGHSDELLLKITAELEETNMKLAFERANQGKEETKKTEENAAVPSGSVKNKKSKSPGNLSLDTTLTEPPEDLMPPTIHEDVPSPRSPLLRTNPMSPSIPSPPPAQYLLHSPCSSARPSGSSLRSPNRAQTGLPPLSPDFLTSKHGRSPTSLENLRRSNKESVPRFYWPEGKPPPTAYIQQTLAKAEAEFSKFHASTTATTSLNYEEFGKFLQSLGISLYWKKPFWTALGLQPSSKLQLEPFKGFYRTLISQCPDEASRFMRILWTARTVLTANEGDLSTFPCGKALDTFPIEFKKIELQMADFVPMIQDIIDTHPGLGFLREAPEFHSRYVTTVISRIFYKVNRSWSGRLTLTEVRRSNLLRVMKRLEEETDVNAITDYFSYEHFYVIYCKFWELDKDHDLLIDKIDLSRHNDQALSSLIVDRIFSGTVLRGWDINSTTKCPTGKMTYSDFVWFIISEEDKKDPTAIEYWFRCLDLDGDGILSPYELQYFYREQEARIIALGIEPLEFSNIFCQMVDMLRCSSKGVRLKDLKKNPQLAATFFNTLFNLDKYLDHEQRDPFASSSSGILGLEIPDSGETDWDRFAATEYELLIAEESPSDHIHNDSSDFEELPS